LRRFSYRARGSSPKFFVYRIGFSVRYAEPADARVRASYVPFNFLRPSVTIIVNASIASPVGKAKPQTKKGLARRAERATNDEADVRDRQAEG
jgi:hypothetical protein